jgi:hypothetical protein
LAFDLRAALLRKQETETARLVDFEFRLRARTMRLLAPAIGEPAEALVALVALHPDEGILERLADARPDRAPELQPLYARARAEARAQLIAEYGDPAPHRLA